MSHTSPQTNAHSDKPEASVISDIDVLIDEQLAQGDCSRSFAQPLAVLCSHCGAEWHGLPQGCCPGAYDAVDAPAQDESYVDQVMRVTLQYAREQAGETIGGPWVSGRDAGEIVVAGVMMPDCMMMPAFTDLPQGIWDHQPYQDPLARMQRLVDGVIAMLGQVCGIHVEPNDIDGATAHLEEMVQAHREERQRQGRIRSEVINRFVRDSRRP